MHFLIYHKVRTDKNTKDGVYQEFRIHTRQLTIGRASDQHVQINEPTVEPNHALISLRTGGELYVQSLTHCGIPVNAECYYLKQLIPGDTIRIGSVTITVQQFLAEEVVALTVDRADANNSYNLESLHLTTLRQTRLSKSFWSWMLAVSILLLFFAIPVLGLFSPPVKQLLNDHWLLPDDSFWSTGPLHQSHQIIGKDCNTCHTTPFKMVRNEQCIECHRDIQHHVDTASNDTEHFHHNRCANCHREHNEPSILVQPDQRFCSDCHQNLKKLKNDTTLADMSDFGSDHPEFSLTLLKPVPEETQTYWKTVRIKPDSSALIQEESNLKFSHKDHLDPKGVRSPDGDILLDCQDCHRPNTSGRQMLPIKMEKHCGACHRLDLDENNSDKQVPHGDLDALFDTLKEYFSHQYLELNVNKNFRGATAQLRRPNAQNLGLSNEDRKHALDWAKKQSLMIAQDLIEKRACVDCHQISRVSGKTESEQWHVKPVSLNGNWMPLARFNHAKHASESCTSCHKATEESEQSSDILMPKIEICRECHGGKKQKDRLVSSCLMCHKFHLPDRGLFDDEAQQSVAEKSIAEKNVPSPITDDTERF